MKVTCANVYPLSRYCRILSSRNFLLLIPPGREGFQPAIVWLHSTYSNHLYRKKRLLQYWKCVVYTIRGSDDCSIRSILHLAHKPHHPDLHCDLISSMRCLRRRCKRSKRIPSTIAQSACEGEKRDGTVEMRVELLPNQSCRLFCSCCSRWVENGFNTVRERTAPFSGRKNDLVVAVVEIIHGNASDGTRLMGLKHPYQICFGEN